MTTGTPNYQTPPPKGGMPKWLVILLVILLVIVVGCCGIFAVCGYFVKKGIDAAPAAMEDLERRMRLEEERVRAEAARRGGVAEDVALPASWPTEVPVYSGLKAKFVMAPPGSTEGAVSFEGPASPKQVSEFYEKELTGKGWELLNSQKAAGGTTQQFRKGERSVIVVTDGTSTSCTAQVSYSGKGGG